MPIECSLLKKITKPVLNGNTNTRKLKTHFISSDATGFQFSPRLNILPAGDPNEVNLEEHMRIL